VTDERRALSVADLETDLRVTHPGEISGTVLEEVSRDLVDAGVVLNDGDFGREEHFGSATD